jgi:hypothetical protein
MEDIPSIGIRNMKGDIRKERDWYEFNDYLQSFEYFISLLSLLKNKQEKTRNKIYQKIFKSGATIDQMISFLEDKENLIQDKDITKKQLLNWANSK